MKNILLFCFTLLCTLGVQAGDLIDLILIHLERLRIKSS